jgi:ClpP class serine protease
VEQVAQGRVWYGDEAQGHGLVDEMGGLEEAIAEARRVAHVPAGEKIDLLTYRRPAPSLIERLVGTALRETWQQTLAPREVTGLQLRADVDDE